MLASTRAVQRAKAAATASGCSSVDMCPHRSITASSTRQN